MNNNTVNAQSVAPKKIRYTTTSTLTVNDTDYTVITTHTDWGVVLTTVLDTVDDYRIEFPVLRPYGDAVDMCPILSTTVAIDDYYLTGLIASAVAYANARRDYWQ